MNEILKTIMEEIKDLQNTLENAHKAIDAYYTSGSCCMGFGPMTQSQIINGCNKRLTELQNQLVELGIEPHEARKICEDYPTGYTYEKCQEFLTKGG